MKLVLFSLILLASSIAIDLQLISNKLQKPVHMCSPEGLDEHIYIVEQRGKIIKIDKNNNVSTFLNFTDRVKSPIFPGDERGLLGMAFHPEYKKNGIFFINYIDNNENTMISKITHNNIDQEFEEMPLITFKQPYSNHNGGHLSFGPDGYLYIGVGDGGSSGDPHKNAQNLYNFFGKILRIDVSNDKYTIPKNNPFINTDAKEEIWAYGLRNPWKFSFDKKSNMIFIADVGQNSWEEINIQKIDSGGLNYGWNIMEGNHVFLDQEPDKFIELNELDLINPSIEYSSNANYGKTLAGFKQSINAIGCSITGGYVYRGHEIDEIKGHYFFADYCTGKIWSIKNFTSENYEIIDWTDDLLEKKKKQIYISSFAEDSKKNLYILDHSGSIFKIINEKR
tara:strand:- start:7200 stop:8381 length:1182 start_codon:yes stop_codon:yes gene_type:complete